MILLFIATVVAVLIALVAFFCWIVGIRYDREAKEFFGDWEEGR